MIGSQTNILVIALNVRRSFGTVLFELGYSLWRLFAPSRAASSVLRQSKSIGTTEWRRRLTERADSGSRSKSSARAFNTTELPTIAEEIEETSAGHTQYTDSYAFYLSICLSVVNSRIGTRMRRQRTIRSPIREDLVSQIRALKAHPFANRKHAFALVPFLSFADQEIAAVAAEAFISLSDWLAALR